jgi:hypothetical protein
MSARERRALNRNAKKGEDVSDEDISPVTRRFGNRNSDIVDSRRNGGLFPDLYTTLEVDVECVVPLLEFFS